MTKYEKDCMYCKEKITMSDETGNKWLPYNKDGSGHDCRNNGNGKDKDKGKETTTEQPETKKEITFEQVRKKLESIGIVIDVDRLMKEK